MELGVSQCFVAWIWSFLRDRRAKGEYLSATSGERVYRAGLPQGSVLSPALLLLWAALLATFAISLYDRVFLPDDTTVLCSENSI